MLCGTEEAAGLIDDVGETLEVSGPSHRIGLSGANKRMLHLLKKAKVQLIKIDQQKQLKLSQVRKGYYKGSLELFYPHFSDRCFITYGVGFSDTE